MINKLITRIKALISDKKFVIIGIDGRCGAGKTTLANKIQESIPCNIIHMDDFFLQAHQRTEKRLLTPGGNTDRERFFKEVLVPLTEHREFSYRPYSCKTGSLGDEIKISPSALTIIEGSYSCHPNLAKHYDMRIFTDIDSDTQMQRIINRNGSGAEMFRNKWIPMEEKYFNYFFIKENSDFQITII